MPATLPWLTMRSGVAMSNATNERDLAVVQAELHAAPHREALQLYQLRLHPK
jgi:hypothetical protein